MKPIEETLNIEEADAEAVLDHAFHGKSLDPEVLRRVRERSEKLTEELRQQHGVLNVAVDLIRECRDEA